MKDIKDKKTNNLPFCEVVLLPNGTKGLQIHGDYHCVPCCSSNDPLPDPLHLYDCISYDNSPTITIKTTQAEQDYQARLAEYAPDLLAAYKKLLVWHQHLIKGREKRIAIKRITLMINEIEQAVAKAGIILSSPSSAYGVRDDQKERLETLAP